MLREILGLSKQQNDTGSKGGASDAGSSPSTSTSSLGSLSTSTSSNGLPEEVEPVIDTIQPLHCSINQKRLSVGRPGLPAEAYVPKSAVRDRNQQQQQLPRCTCHHRPVHIKCERCSNLYEVGSDMDNHDCIDLAPQLLISRAEELPREETYFEESHAMPSPLDASSYNPVMMSMHLLKQRSPGTPAKAVSVHLARHHIYAQTDVVLETEGSCTIESLFSPKKCRILAVFVPYRHKATQLALVTREPVSLTKVLDQLVPSPYSAFKSKLTFHLDSMSVPGDYLVQLFFNDSRQTFSDCTSKCDNEDYREEQRPNFIRYEPTSKALPHHVISNSVISPAMPYESRSSTPAPSLPTLDTMLEQLAIDHNNFFKCREEIMKNDFGSMFAVDMLTLLVCVQSSPLVGSGELENVTGIVLKYFAQFADLFRHSLLMHLAARNLNHVIDVLVLKLSEQELKQQLLHVDCAGRDAPTHARMAGNITLADSLHKLQQEKAGGHNDYMSDQNFAFYSGSHMDQLSSMISSWIEREMPQSGSSTPYSSIPTFQELPLSYSFQM